jgi:hypothetical protein
MAQNGQNLYLTRKTTQWCKRCKKDVNQGQIYCADSEESKGLCFNCSPFRSYTLLPPGNVAMTRRSKKHSTLCGVLLEWNQRRRRYERKGQYVEQQAIEKARVECEVDAEKRKLKNAKAAVVRAEQDKTFIRDFSTAIRLRYPSAPQNRENKIAAHACEKHSGRVGRSAGAKEFDPEMIDRAVEAHIRHQETNYDNEFGKGKRKREIRGDLKFEIKQLMAKWRRKDL